MFTVTAFKHLVEGLRAIYGQQRTERAVADLPPALRRDIGWPEAYRETSTNGHGRNR